MGCLGRSPRLKEVRRVGSQSKRTGVLLGRERHLWDLALPQVGSVRGELNHRTPSWGHREVLVVGKTPWIW